MLSNIIVAIMCVIAAAAGIFVWRIESGGLSKDAKKTDDKKDAATEKIEGIGEDEKN